MENLKKDYPHMFKKIRVRMEGKSRTTTILENTPIVSRHDTHIEVRKDKDSSPLILSKSYKL